MADDLVAQNPELLDEAGHPDRDSLIRGLVARLGRPAAEVAGRFGISARQVRRIAAEAPGIPPRRRPVLAMDESRSMMIDYLQDPYTRQAEAEAAGEWIEGQVCPA